MKLATLCYVRRQGQTLMIHRIKKANDMHLGKWNGLGGKLNPGESPEECAVREIFEDNFEGELINTSEEGVLRWVDNADLLSLNLWEGDRIFLPWLDQPGFFSGKFIYKEGRLLSHEVVFYP
jgi:8-oxo-dGTP diphosphatase